MDRAAAVTTPWLRITTFAFIGALALVLCGALAPSQVWARAVCPNENAPVSTTSAPLLRAAVLCLVNETRQEHGLPALSEDARLDQTAQQHTDDMVTNHYFAHNSQDGTTPFQRMTAAGYNWAQAGENIAQGYSTPIAVMEGWMYEASPYGHCRSILEPGFRDLGVGVNPGAADARYTPGTWTQDFGRLQGVPPPSTDTTAQNGCPYHLEAVTPTSPVASTDPATGTGGSQATLNSTINPNGSATTYKYEYGKTTAFGTVVGPFDAGSGTVPVAQPPQAITGLAPATTYYYRVCARNAANPAPAPQTCGQVVPFTTTGGPTPPSAVTAPASAISDTSASLSGTVNAHGQATAYTFEYGTSTSFGQIAPVPSGNAGSSTADLPVGVALSGLAPNTTYFYRLVATNNIATTNGQVLAFTTTGPATTPTASTGSAGAITSTSATLSGTVNPNGQQTWFTFEYGTTTSFGQISAVDNAGAGTTPQNLSLPISGLAPHTTYLYRIVASNATLTTTGAVMSLTTP